MDIRNLLAKANEAYKSVQPSAVGGYDLPAGRYQAQMSEGVVRQDKDGAVRARVQLQVVSAPDATLIGRKTSKSWNIIGKDGSLDERGVGYLKADMGIVGLACDDLSKINEAIGSMSDMVVDITVQVKTMPDGTERTNIYINSLVRKGGAVSF